MCAEKVNAPALPVVPAAAQDIVIGVAAPMSGNLAQIGKQFSEGAQLAADDVGVDVEPKSRGVATRLEVLGDLLVRAGDHGGCRLS